MKLLFLDTETTGNEIGKDRLCQVCFYDNDAKEMTVEYFKPPMPISVKAMSITHITNKMVEDKPTFIGSPTFLKLQELLKTHTLVAHNAPFDIGVLEAEGLSVPHSIDTLRVARALDEAGTIPEYGLQYLRYYLGLEVEGSAHDAEGDVNVLRAVFERMHAKLVEKLGDSEKAYAEMERISSEPTLFKKINFGKHKGKAIDEVAKSDRSYLEWLYDEKCKKPEGEDDWLHTLRHFLGLKK